MVDSVYSSFNVHWVYNKHLWLWCVGNPNQVCSQMHVIRAIIQFKAAVYFKSLHYKTVTVQRPTLWNATIKKQYLWLNMIIQHYCTYCILWLDMHLALHKISHTPYPFMAANTDVNHNEKLANASTAFCVRKYTPTPQPPRNTIS